MYVWAQGGLRKRVVRDDLHEYPTVSRDPWMAKNGIPETIWGVNAWKWGVLVKVGGTLRSPISSGGVTTLARPVPRNDRGPISLLGLSNPTEQDVGAGEGPSSKLGREFFFIHMDRTRIERVVLRHESLCQSTNKRPPPRDPLSRFRPLHGRHFQWEESLNSNISRR